jgi:uncharacterized protein YcbK (DUF882 family)
MGDLSEHFSRAEFACRCNCGLDTVDVKLLEALELLHAKSRQSVYINDACRCVVHNAKVGGAPTSQHLIGKAADMRSAALTPDQVADFFEQQFPNSHGIGRYDTFTHIDVRAKKARWDFRTKK